ncbi:MAG: AmmeMemoRadiSam system radical SAM enzyme [bacterium]
MKAAYQRQLPGGKIRCDLCPHHCVIAEGATGLCKVRGVRGGELSALCYGMVSSAALDPIEKKPLYHFYPGSMIFSIGGWGCNFSCSFCQNWSISQQAESDTAVQSPAAIVREANRLGSIGLAYTYNEPLVGFEFAVDCAVAAKNAGLANVLVTNGYVAREPASEILPLIDALNIDIKSMDDSFYRELCNGRLGPVLEFSKQAVAAGCHVEITNLVIPGRNDEDRHFETLAGWISTNLGRLTPLHLSAYHPDYKLDIGPTPVANLENAHRICSRALDYVYVGNVRSGKGQNTSCPGCHSVLVERQGYRTEVRGIAQGKCSVCGRPVDMTIGAEP